MQFLFEDPVNDKRGKASSEMGDYSVLSGEVYWSCLEFCLHNAEAFFDFPAFPVDSDDFGNIIIKISTDSIQTIISGFFIYLVLIE